MAASPFIVLALLAIAHGAPVQTRLGPQHQQAPAPMCGSCVWLVKTLKCEVADPDTQDQIMRLLLQDLCAELPVEARESCTQLVPALVPTAMMYLQSLSAKELCAGATLCTSAPARQYALPQQIDSNYCPMCKMVVIGLKQELKNPVTAEVVMERMHAVRSLSLRCSDNGSTCLIGKGMC